MKNLILKAALGLILSLTLPATSYAGVDGGGGGFIPLQEASEKALQTWLKSDAGQEYLHSNEQSQELNSNDVRLKLLGFAEDTLRILESLQQRGIRYSNSDFGIDLEKYQEVVQGLGDLSKIQIILLKDFDFKDSLLKKTKMSKREQKKEKKIINDLVFWNIPNLDNPGKGTLLVNTKKYIKYLDKIEVTPFEIEFFSRKEASEYYTMKFTFLALISHEIIGLTGSQEDLEYQVSGILPHHFSRSFNHDFITKTERECKEIDELAKQRLEGVNTFKMSKETALETVEEAKRLVIKRERLRDLAKPLPSVNIWSELDDFVSHHWFMTTHCTLKTGSERDYYRSGEAYYSPSSVYQLLNAATEKYDSL